MSIWCEGRIVQFCHLLMTGKVMVTELMDRKEKFVLSKRKERRTQ